jgi:hypothetical protein
VRDHDRAGRDDRLEQVGHLLVQRMGVRDTQPVLDAGPPYEDELGQVPPRVERAHLDALIHPAILAPGIRWVAAWRAGQDVGMQGTVSILVDRPDTRAYLTVSDLDALLAWSAWPHVAGGGGRLVGDGTSLGSELLLLDPRGDEQGRLRLVATALHTIGYELEVRVRRGRHLPVGLEYRLQDVGGSATIVVLDVKAPVRAGLPGLGDRRLARRLVALAARDLAGLKAHLEGTPPG